MKRIKAWSLSLLLALLIAGIGYKVSQDPFFTRFTTTVNKAETVNVPNTLVAPTVANDFFSAFCSHDAAYIAANTGGALTVSEAEMADYFAQTTMQCVGFRYLGSLTPTPGTQQYVYVIDAGVDGEVWFVLSVVDGVAVDLE